MVNGFYKKEKKIINNDFGKSWKKDITKEYRDLIYSNEGTCESQTN